MLSPGKYHLAVPSDLLKNLDYRKRLILACRRKRAYRKAVLRMCRDDLFYFINVFVWQVNPKRVGSEIGPFISWDFQEELLRDTMARLFGRYPDDILWEKSREMGATWLALILALWLCLFHPNKRVLCISHSEEAVDKATDEGTLFAKIQFILDFLPGWMKEGVKKRKKVYSFKGRSTISAAATSERSGVGDRVTMVLLDEFSKQREGYAIWGQTADTGPRLVIGTHYGLDSCYYDLSRRPDMHKRVLHWTQHPEKAKGLYHTDDQGRFVPHDPQFEYPPDFSPVLMKLPSGGPFPGVRSPWYDHECRRRHSVQDVAMHLDINPTGASSQFYEPLTIESLRRKCRPPLWTGDLFHSTDEARPIELMPGEGEGGPLELWVQPGLNSSGKLLKVPNGEYIVSADLGTGQGATPSCISIFNASIGLKVGTYTHSFKDAKQMAWLAVSLCRMFLNEEETAFLAWECPGPGLIFGNEVLKAINYRKIYWKTEAFRDDEKETDVPGWHAAPASKLQLHSQYKIALASGLFVNYDEKSLVECLAYVHSNGTVDHPKAKKNVDPAAVGTNHGDHVVADALGWLMAKKRGLSLEPVKREAVVPANSMMGRRLSNDRLKRASAGIWA